MQSPLSKEQQEEYNRIAASKNLQSEQAALELCLEYYRTYRKAVAVPGDKIGLALKCSYYMAEKSQYNVTVQGQRIRAVSFSLNSLLKEHKLDDTMFMLKEMAKKVRFNDEDTGAYLSNVVKEISFLITLHSKFEKTFTQKLELKERERGTDSSYIRTFTSFAWLLFVICKNEILHNSLDLLPNTCMIASIITSILIISWESVKPEGLFKGERISHERTMSREASMLIKEKVLEIFCVKDITEYGKIAKLFQNYLNQMIDNNFFRISNEKLDFLSPAFLSYNYQKLDKYYENTLKENPEKLDERIFFKERSMNLTPSKFTPFARQGYVNKFQKQTIGGKLGMPTRNKEQTFNSHRILNYEAAEKEVETRQMPISDIKLPKNIMQSPSMVKVPLIVTTPISSGMEMYNFLNEKKKRLQLIKQQERTLDKQIFTYIDNIFSLERKEADMSKNTKQEMIVALYKIYSEEYLAANPNEKDTPELLKAFLALSIELVFFVSNITLSFQDIEKEIEFSAVEMWKAISHFLSSDKSIPSPIKLHFLDIEVNLISSKIWESETMIENLFHFVNKNLKGAPEVDLMEKLFRRSLHQIAFQITRLSANLEIEESISEKFFDTMKEIIVNHTHLLYRRHFDQLVICCTYVLSKTPTRTIKFNEIKERYIESNCNLKSEEVENLFASVHIEQDQYEDIIYFYNHIFLKNEKLIDFVKMKKNTGATPAGHYAKKNEYLNSPLREIIPKEFGFKSKNALPKSKNGMTPQSQLLFAYNESPILKYEVNAFKGPLKNKKILNFDELEENLKNRCEQETTVKQPVVSDNVGFSNFSTPMVSQTTNDFITKKYVARKSPTPGTQNYLTHQTGMQLMDHTRSKENMTPPLSSHRTLFEDKRDPYDDKKGLFDDKKGLFDERKSHHLDEKKFKLKGYQFAGFK